MHDVTPTDTRREAPAYSDAPVGRRGLLRGVGIGALALASASAVTLGDPRSAQAAAGEHVTSAKWQVQSTGYYCAPTACAIALSARGKTFSQQDLAARLGTTENGTDFGNVVPVLATLAGTTYEKAWLGGNSSPAAQKQLWDRVRTDIDAGFPVVANWVVAPHTYPHYSNPTKIWHYVTITGYDTVHSTLKIADPSGAPFNPAVPGEYWWPLADVTRLCAEHGYIF